MATADTDLIKGGLDLKDGRRRPVTSASRIVLQAATYPDALTYCAEGKEGEVTHFRFELPPGMYTVRVKAEGFRPYEHVLTLSQDEGATSEFVLYLALPEREDEEKGDAAELDAFFKWFALLRTTPGEVFPSDGREKALEQKRHMNNYPLTEGLSIPEGSPSTPDTGFHEALLAARTAVPAASVDCVWTSLGPRNINGRVRALAIHPNNGNIIYAGTANAGVWVTYDRGGSWQPLMHSEDALEIGALAVHLTDPAQPDGPVTIYAGTGEVTGHDGYNGIGVLKSTIHGQPGIWQQTMLTGTDSARFSVILVDPTSVSSNPKTTIVYAGGTGGLYMSTNGGDNWSKIYDKMVTGLALHPTNNNLLYVAVSSVGIYEIDLTKDTKSVFEANRPNFNGNLIIDSALAHLILIAIAKSDPGTMYAKVGEAVYKTVYKYGQEPPVPLRWKPLGLHGGSNGSINKYWNNVLAVDPINSNIVFAGGTYLERSARGGEIGSWQLIPQDIQHYDPPPLSTDMLRPEQPPSYKLHPDQHTLVFDPQNPLNVFVANDGGIFQGSYPATLPPPTDPSLQSDPGIWTKISHGLTLTQFYKVGVFPAVPAAPGVPVLSPLLDVVGGGTQDNGPHYTAGGLTWNNFSDDLGYDSGAFIVDPTNPSILYVQEPNNTAGIDIRKSVDGGANWNTVLTFNSGVLPVIPLILDPNSLESNRVLFAGGLDIKTNTYQVCRTTDSGITWHQFGQDFQDKDTNSNIVITAIALAPSSSAIVFVGAYNFGDYACHLYRNADNGATGWREITDTSLPPRVISAIAVDRTNPDIVYLAFNGYASVPSTNPDKPNKSGYVFRGTSADQGKTWQWENISLTLPDTPVNAIVLDYTSPDTLYIGTDTGVYRTTDAGATSEVKWSSFDAGLPNVVILDLALNTTGDILYAATYGYGMFRLRLRATCNEVDVYIRDNQLDIGEILPYKLDDPTAPLLKDPTVSGIPPVYWWQSVDIKTNCFPSPSVPVEPDVIDGVDFDQAQSKDIIPNSHNYLYVQVLNRGLKAAHEVKVKVLWTDASAGMPPLPADFWSSFPDDWKAESVWNPVGPVQALKKELLPSTPQILKWDWEVPVTATDQISILAIVSSKEDPVVRSDAVADDHRIEVIVPGDKHIAVRNLNPITLPTDFAKRPLQMALYFYNSLPYPQFFDITIDERSLPRDSQITLLIPKILTELPTLSSRGKKAKISRIIGQEWWWDQLEAALLEALLGGCHIEIGSDDDDDVDHGHDGHEPVRIHRVFIPANDRLRATLLVTTSPATARPGSTYQFTVTQHVGATIMGGSTYEVRIPPAQVAFYECSE